MQSRRIGHGVCFIHGRISGFHAGVQFVGCYSNGGKMTMNRKGFTLIELLIVVVIIGILAAIAIPKFANTKGKAYIASMKSDLRNLVTAEEAYFADSVKYSDIGRALVGTPVTAASRRQAAACPKTGHTADAALTADGGGSAV